jgi:hypothetical protein
MASNSESPLPGFAAIVGKLMASPDLTTGKGADQSGAGRILASEPLRH